MSSETDPRVAAINADLTCSNDDCDAGPAAQEKATAGNWRCLECGDLYEPGDRDD